MLTPFSSFLISLENEEKVIFRCFRLANEAIAKWRTGEKEKFKQGIKPIVYKFLKCRLR